MSLSDLSFGFEPKLLDGSFNNNRTSTHFGGKAMFCGNDAINLHTSRAVQPAAAAKQPSAKQPAAAAQQPSAKLMDNWFNGNHITTRAKADARMMMPM